MTDETTTEQLVEIEGQAAQYTPPEGWRVLQVGERLRDGDMIVRKDGSRYPAERLGGWVGSNQRHIRPIEPQPQPEPEPVQVREGRWRTRNGEIKDIRPCEPLKGAYYVWPWTDGFMTYQDNGLHQGSKESPNDLIEYLGPIEQQPQPQPIQVREGRWRTRGGEIRNVTPTPEDDDRVTQYPWCDAEYDQTWASNGRCYLDEESQRDLVQYLGPIEQPEKDITPDDVAGEALAGTINEWPSVQIVRREVEKLQGELGEAKRRVVELETLVADLRTINEATEKTVRAAGRQNADLQHRLDVVSKEWAEQAATFNGLQQQLEAVKAELVQQAETSRRLQIELDAAQQVPADSPELRQLRADLEQVTRERDEYRYAHDVLVKDANTVHERTKAMTVEAIAEWLEPVRLIDSPSLANETLQHLPQIMRSLVGLDTPEDVD